MCGMSAHGVSGALGARGSSFYGGMPFHTNQLGIGKRHWNLETSSAVVEFPPPYHKEC